MVEFNIGCNMKQFMVNTLVILATLNIVLNKNKALGGSLHKTKRSTGNCIESTSEINNIFPMNAVQDIKCKPGCHEIKKTVKYAVIEIKEVVVGCRGTKELPKAKTIVMLDAITQKMSRVCKDNFKTIKANITEVFENGDILEAKKREIIIDCV